MNISKNEKMRELIDFLNISCKFYLNTTYMNEFISVFSLIFFSFSYFYGQKVLLILIQKSHESTRFYTLILSTKA